MAYKAQKLTEDFSCSSKLKEESTLYDGVDATEIFNDHYYDYEFQRLCLRRSESDLDLSDKCSMHNQKFSRMSLDDAKSACATASIAAARERIMNAAFEALEAQQRVDLEIFISDSISDSEEDENRITSRKSFISFLLCLFQSKNNRPSR